MDNRTTSAEWPYEVLLLSLDDVFIDTSYQRPPVEPFVEKMVNSFDETLVGVIDASERKNGSKPKYAVLDGQQRFESLKKVGKTTVYAAVYTGMTVGDEAIYFYRRNHNRRGVHPFYNFRAKMVAGDPTCKAINFIVESQGYKLAATAGGDRYIPSIRAVEEAYSFASPNRTESLSASLNMLHRAFYGRKGGKNGELIRGLGRFFQPFSHDEIDLQWLEDALSKENPRAIVSRARDAWYAGTHHSNPVADEIVKVYNRGRKKGKLNRNFLTKTAR